MNALAGIVWDPREPLPPELGGVGRYDANEGFRPFQYNQIPHAYRDHSPTERIVPELRRGVLPPLSISLRARIVQDTAKITLTQLFWNDTDELIQNAAYTLPLPSGCTVTDFSCVVGRDKLIRAKIKAKKEARDAHEQAVRNNQTSALFEQATNEVFTTTLGNIPRQTKLKAEISYITLLRHGFAERCTTTTLTIPTYIASRYGSPPALVQNSTLSSISRTLSFEIEVTSAEHIRKIYSTTHGIIVDRHPGITDHNSWQTFTDPRQAGSTEIASVKLQDETSFLNTDFVLNIVTATNGDIEQPQAWVENHPSFPNHKALMVTIPPNFFLNHAPLDESGEVIFIADRSGSMSDKMISLKSALAFFLQSIPVGRKFNIWCFGSHYTSLWPTSQRNSSEYTLNKAKNYVKTEFNPNMGGTQLLQVLKAVVGSRDRNQMTDIIVLTDGQIWQMKETLDFVQNAKLTTNGNIRVFALGIGDAVSHELVEGLAKAGGGYAEVIPAASSGGWEDRLVAMLKAAIVGHIPPLQLKLQGVRSGFVSHADASGAHHYQRPHPLQSPADVSTLSPFLRNRVYMLLESPVPETALEKVQIESSGQEYCSSVRIRPIPRADDTIHKLAVRAVLGDLERGQSWIPKSPAWPARHSSEEQILTNSEGEFLGCKWALVSRWTSFHAVAEDFDATMYDADPFMNDIDAHRPTRGIDLLRPRGVPGQPSNSSTPAESLEEQQGDDNNDEEEESSSDSDTQSSGGLTASETASRRRGNDDDDPDGQRLGRNNNGSTGSSERRTSDNSGQGGDTTNNEQQESQQRRYSGNRTQLNTPVGFLSRTQARHRVTRETTRLRPVGLNYLIPVTHHSSPAPYPYHSTDMTQPRVPRLGLSTPSTVSSARDMAQLQPSRESAETRSFSSTASLLMISTDEKRRTSFGIVTPEYKASSASAMMSDQTSTPKSEEQQHKEDIIRKLVQYQSFDGAFHLPGDLELGFELPFIGWTQVQSVIKEIDIAARENLPPGLSNTIAIVVLLELNFVSCQDLWLLIVRKARTWIAIQIGREPEELYMIARKQLSNVELGKPETSPSRVPAFASSENQLPERPRPSRLKYPSPFHSRNRTASNLSTARSAITESASTDTTTQVRNSTPSTTNERGDQDPSDKDHNPWSFRPVIRRTRRKSPLTTDFESGTKEQHDHQPYFFDWSTSDERSPVMPDKKRLRYLGRNVTLESAPDHEDW